MTSSPTLLVFNVGSSSVKYRIFALDTLTELKGGKVTGISTHHGITHEQAIQSILDKQGTQFSAVAHRVVHGGNKFLTSLQTTPDVIEHLKSFIPFAPLHQPHNIAAIEIITKICPNLPQFVCFDTAFHQGHAPLFDTYAIPKTLRDEGLKRYGFHGLSYQWITHVLAEQYPNYHAGRVVVAHLGNGSSLCAIKNGRSIDTTMGLTALDGVPMGTRSGSIDPGLVLYLIQHNHMSVDEVDDLLYNQSGLLGLSGITNDVKDLLESDSPHAAFALDVYSLKVAQAIATMGVSLGGIDAIVFTGGIGENAAPVRDKILSHIAHLGVIPHLVLKTNEEWIMAYEVKELLHG